MSISTVLTLIFICIAVMIAPIVAGLIGYAFIWWEMPPVNPGEWSQLVRCFVFGWFICVTIAGIKVFIDD